MKNILILANSEMAKHFVQWVGKRRINNNEYYITCSSQLTDTSSTAINNFNFIDIDPTSLFRLKEMMSKVEFTTIYVVMSKKDEALVTLENIEKINPKLMVVFVSKWDDLLIEKENVSVVNLNELLSVNLYEKLPNVPKIAKNIGLGKGEIMEILVPFGSSFAYRHIGAISHRKWKVVAIYRKEKQIFPNNATMLMPNDRLIVIGNPIVLEELYKRVNKRQGVFPEPFGKNLYLIIDMLDNKDEIEKEIEEALYLKKILSKTKLYIRFINIQDLNRLKNFRELEEDKNIFIMISYKDNEIFLDIDYDISQFDIGMFLLSKKLFFKREYKNYLYELMRPIYLFGNNPISKLEKVFILIGKETDMESLSTSVFDFSESFNLKLILANYNPEGDFEESKNIIEHYESLSTLYNFHIFIEEKRVNPIRELMKKEKILYISPFLKIRKETSLINFLLSKFASYFLSIQKHPQLLIPIDS
jgi:hypothetical protein